MIFLSCFALLQVDMLNEKLAAAGGEAVQISDEAKEQHTKQVAALRDEVAEKSRKIEELTVSRPVCFIFLYFYDL